MDSADGTHDEDFEQPYVPSGARRSTFTPPASPPPTAESSAPELHDDDELAAALAAENDRILSNTQNIPVQSAATQGLFEPGATFDDETPEHLADVAPGAPAAASGAPSAPPTSEPSVPRTPIVPESEDRPTPAIPEPASIIRQEHGVEAVDIARPAGRDEGASDSDDRDALSPDAMPSPEEMPSSGTDGFALPEAAVAEEPVAEEPVAEEPVAEEPAGAATGPDVLQGIRPVPERHSLADEDIVRALDAAADQPVDTLSLIEKLEAELTRRQHEDLEYRVWENSTLALGTSEAVQAVQDARETLGSPVVSSAEDVSAQEGPAVQPEQERFAFEQQPTPAVSEPLPAASPVAETVESATSRPGVGIDHEAAESEAPAERETEVEREAEAAQEPEAEHEPEAERELRVGQDTAPEPAVERALPSAEPERTLAALFGPPPRRETDSFSEPEPSTSPEPASQVEASADDFDALLGGDTPIPLADGASPSANDARKDGTPPDGPLAAAAVIPVIDDVPSTEEPFVEAFAPFDRAMSAVRTGSIDVVDRLPAEELSDTDEETEHFSGGVGGTIAVDTMGIAVIQSTPAPPSGPVATTRVAHDEVVVAHNEPVKQPIFSLEESGLEPTPLDQRVGHASRMFWLWFAANSSVVSIGFGAVIFSLGMSLRQAIIAAVVGVALAFLPLGLGTLAGKRSGQPAMVISRASFGLLGNILPAAVAVVSRLFWGAVFLWLLAVSAASVLGGGALGATPLAFIVLAIAFLLVLAIAFAGYPLLSRVQLVLSILSGILIVGFIGITAGHVDFSAAVLGTADGSWWLVVTGAILVFSFLGLAWANSSSDLARYQRVGSSGTTSMLWASFGTALPAFVLIAYGILLAASDPALATALAQNPLDAIASLLPAWYPIPLLLATALSLLSGAAVTLYSAGFALQATGLRLRRQFSVILAGVVLLAIAALLTATITGGVSELVRDLATSLAVPVAAWTGIFASDVMIRRRRYHSVSLLRRGGVYPDVNWVNLVAYVVIVAISFGFTSASVGWLSWQGYLFPLFGTSADSVVAGTDLGVLLALVLGLVTPIVAGIGVIRRQEDIEGRLHARENARSAE